MTDGLVRLDSLDPTALARTRAIYEDGFAPQHRAPWTEVSVEVLGSETALALVADGVPVGFVLLRAMGDTGGVYLRYLVIDAARRGHGVGSAAWKDLLAHCVRSGFALLIWDVEHPDDDDIDGPELAIRRRRVVFYERLGGIALPVPDYTNPHEDASGTHEVPMVLMATALDGSALPVHDPQWLSAVVRDVDHYRWNR